MNWPTRRDEWPEEEWGEKPDIFLNEMQVQVLAALFRGDPIIGVQAGWGSGKTAALIFAMQTISWLEPGKTSVLVTDTRPRYDRVLHPEIDKWCTPLGWKWHERKATWTDPHTRSKFMVVWYYQHSTKSSTHNPLEGINATSGFALADECQVLPHEVAEKLTGRIRSGRRPIRLFVGLPETNAWWIDLAGRRGVPPIMAESQVNEANLGDGWLEDAFLTLTEEEYESMVKNKPRARVGQVYHEWSWKAWPEGNLAPSWWSYKPEMIGRISIDPGLRKPSVVIIVHDKDPRWGPEGAHIVVAEINHLRLSTQELIEDILEIAWPRAQAQLAPGPRIWLDEGVIDKAGRQAREHDLRSTADDLERAVHLDAQGIHDGGLGVSLFCTTDPEKVKIPVGIQRVKRIVNHRGVRRLLCTEAVYLAGLKAGKTRNSLQRAVAEYSYPRGSDSSKEEPVKSGIEDPLDAARYYALRWCWYDGPGTAVPHKAPPPPPPPVQAPQHLPSSTWKPGGGR